MDEKLLPLKPKKNIFSKSVIICIILTIFSGVLIFVNLGSTSVPQTYYQTQKNHNIKISFAEQIEFSKVALYFGVADSDGNIKFEFASNQTSKHVQQQIDGGKIFCWQYVYVDYVSANITITFSGVFRINEIAFVDKNGATVDLSNATINVIDVDTATVTGGNEAQKLFDEQNKVSLTNSLLTDMYFDEIYHARTAFEMLNGLPKYERTHPPLGKVLISLGIAVFGMNPFGWRVVGAVFGVAIVPLVYLFAKRFFKSTGWATVAAVLVAVDGLHIAQSRIATLDTIAVFFMVLMYYLMYLFYANFGKDDNKAYTALAVCGITFGAAAAVKFTNIYAGVGLAAIFFYRLRKQPKKQVVKALLSAAVWFVLVGVSVYVLSYAPYNNGQGGFLKNVLENQKFMINYHVGVDEYHASQSAYYSWPFNLKGVFFYIADTATRVSRITSKGLSVMYIFGVFCLVFCVFMMINKVVADKKHFDEFISDGDFKRLVFMVIGYVSVYVPWIFVSRCTFIYHYYPATIFLIFVITFACRQLISMYNKIMFKLAVPVCKKNINVTAGSLTVAVVLSLIVINFLIVLPSLTGYSVSYGYAKFADLIFGCYGL